MVPVLALMLVCAGLLATAFFAPSSSSNAVLLVANKGEQTLGLIDPDAGRQIATAAEPNSEQPHADV